jgi:hypothetical protein
MPAPSLPRPASLKNTRASGTSSANPPELAPPCEALTTTLPASCGSTRVIESMSTTHPRGPWATDCFMQAPRGA